MRLNFEERHPFFRFPRNGGWIRCPMVPVEIIGPSGKSAATYALLDSGADVSLFHAKWADKVGLRLGSGRRENIGGINQGQPVATYFHRIFLKIGSNKLRCEVGFSEDLGEEMNDQLIGREVVFDKMRFALRQCVETVYIGNMP